MSPRERRWRAVYALAPLPSSVPAQLLFPVSASVSQVLSAPVLLSYRILAPTSWRSEFPLDPSSDRTANKR